MIVFLPHGKSAGKASTTYDIDKLTPVLRCSISSDDLARAADRCFGDVLTVYADAVTVMSDVG